MFNKSLLVCLLLTGCYEKIQIKPEPVLTAQTLYITNDCKIEFEAGVLYGVIVVNEGADLNNCIPKAYAKRKEAEQNLKTYMEEVRKARENSNKN